MIRKIVVIICLEAVFCAGLQTVPAAEYRIDNTVSDGKSEGVKSTSYLCDEQFVSIIGKDSEIVIFEKQMQTFVLLHPPLRVQTTLDAAKLREQTEALRKTILTMSKDKPETFAQFAASPKFNRKADKNSGLLALQSHWIDYEFKTIPFPDGDSEKYYDFCDWMCYLNLRLNPKSAMMLTRLTVNQELRREHVFPLRSSSAIYAKGKTTFSQADTLIAESQISRRLSDEDKQRLEQCAGYRRTLKIVSFEEYQQQCAAAANKKN